MIRSGNQENSDFWTIYNRLPRETRGYVPAFIAATYIMNYYCEHGIVPREATLPLESDTVVVQKEMTFAQIASLCNVSVEELRALNPQYRKDIIPVDYVLRLPAETIEDFLQKEDSIYGGKPTMGLLTSNTRRSFTEDVENLSSQPSTVSKNESRSARKSSRSSRSSRSTKTRRQSRSVSVSVKSGDTLSAIAKRNGTTVQKIRQMNGIKGNLIKPGQKVRVK